MSDLSIAVAQMAKAVTSSHSLRITSCQAENDQSSGISPIKLANLCSNYLQQMRDLYNLFEAGALIEFEFFEQKRPILEQLKKLNPV